MKSTNTKRALLVSILSMLLCMAMLVGSTFAWFTDSVSSGKNRIVAGNLDVQLFYKTGGMTDWRDVESLKPEDTDPFFRNVAGDKILWEPGAIGVTSFKVENVGTLSFKYALAFLAVKYNQLDGNDLRDVIKFAVINGELPEDFTAEDVQNLNYSAFPDFTKRSALAPNDGVDNSGEDQEIFTVVAYWKPNSDTIDNLYNLSNGKTAVELDGTPSDPNQLYIDIDIRVNAWQDTVESDSFDNQYDAMADVLDKFPDGCYTVKDHGAWAELDVYTGRSTADINISYTGYAPDNTDELMRDWKTDSSGTIAPESANGDTHLIFFKTADKGSFTLTQDGRVLPALQVEDDGTIGQSMAVYSARNAVAAMSLSADPSSAESISSEDELQSVIAALNTSGGETTVKLSGDIAISNKRELTQGTLTILGEGHSITNKASSNYDDKFSLCVAGTATLNLGADGYDGTLTVKAGSGVRCPLLSVSGNACLNICQGTTLDGSEGKFDMNAGGLAISDTATVNMNGGSIRNCNCSIQAGGVFLSGSAKFNMNGGEITNCRGILGGAVGMSTANVIGGSTGVSNAVFTMNGGTISDCSSVGFNVPGSGWVSGYTVGGAAVCMYGTSNNYKAQFIMNGGLITGCSTDVANAGSNVYGGAIFVSVGTVTLNSGKITNNTVTAGNGNAAYGGGISAHCLATSSSYLTITIENNFKLYNNSAQTAGDDIAHVASSRTYGTLTLNNVKTGFMGDEYSEHTGGTWYTDEAGNRCKDDKGTKISFASSPAVNQKVSKYYIKVVHEEEPEPVYVTITYKDDLHAVENYAQYTVEFGEPTPIPETIPYKKGYVFTGWIAKDTSHITPTAERTITYYAEFCPLEGVGAPGRLLDLYNGDNNGADISNGGAKTVRWCLEYQGLTNRVNASAPIKSGTKITMAYYPDENNRRVVTYYYLIVPADTESISLSDFTAMGESKHFVLPHKNYEIPNPIYQFSFVFPETQGNTSVWMSDTANDAPNGSAVAINFAATGVPVPMGMLTASGNTVTVSGLTGLAADPSDSRHNTSEPLADRKAVLEIEAVDAQGRTVVMSNDTVVTVGGNPAKVVAGIAAAEITGNGTYTIEVSPLPQGAVAIRVSLCYTDNSVIYKPMANVMAPPVTVTP